jgi:hypothetical protein
MKCEFEIFFIENSIKLNLIKIKLIRFSASIASRKRPCTGRCASRKCRISRDEHDEFEYAENGIFSDGKHDVQQSNVHSKATTKGNRPLQLIGR